MPKTIPIVFTVTPEVRFGVTVVSEANKSGAFNNQAFYARMRKVHLTVIRRARK